ncbi:MAG: fluoride efflux transporter CrcB [Kiritimatiellae bacterium]|nr:fluoride efflux transporter CrcB [Kiritimatiellia bacterium]
MNILLVALGSAAGGVVRYLVGTLIPTAGGFPFATLSVNIAGSFLIGLFSGLLARFSGGASAETLRLVLVVGFCGGFTTFSTFSNETLRLIESSHYLAAALYVLASVLAGLLAVFFGYVISR